MKNKSYSVFLCLMMFLSLAAFRPVISQTEKDLENWRKNYNFDKNYMKILSERAEKEQTVNSVNSSESCKINSPSFHSGINQLNKRVQNLINQKGMGKNSGDLSLSNDTLIIGAPPNDSLIIESDFTYNGTILIALNGLLKFKNTKATIYGDIILFNNARLEIENSEMHFPQRYFYERMMFTTGASSIKIKNSSMDFSGLSHTLASAENSQIEIENIKNIGFTTTGLYGKSSISINGSNEAGEFVITDSCILSIKNAKTALLWHHVGKGEKLDIAFPNGDTVVKYRCVQGLPGVSGIYYYVKVDSCRDVMWALMPANGCDVKIKNSKLRAIGLWVTDFAKADLSGLVNNSKYESFTLPSKDIGLTLTNTSLMTWSVYTMDGSDVTLTGSILGEVGAENRSKVTCNKMFCDGSGGYMWGTDTTFTIIGFSSATTSVRSQGNGIVVLAYSALTMGQATAVQNSVLMVLQSSVPEEPVPYNNACVWYANIERPSVAAVNSKVPVLGSVWISKTPTSSLMNFDHYTFYYRHKETDPWIQVPGLFKKEVRHDTLIVWNTAGLVPDNYNIKIVISDNYGDSVEAVRSINLLPVEMAVRELNNDNQNELFPNPADDYLYYCNADLNESFIADVYDLSGRKYTCGYETQGNVIKIITSHLQNGIYYLEIKSKINTLYKKFLINRK